MRFRRSDIPFLIDNFRHVDNLDILILVPPLVIAEETVASRVQSFRFKCSLYFLSNYAYMKSCIYAFLFYCIFELEDLEVDLSPGAHQCFFR